MMIPAHALSGIACIHLGMMFTQRADGSQRWNNSPPWLWLAVGITLAYFSHAIVDALAIFTYHDSSPTGPPFSMLVFWGWLAGGIVLIVRALRTDIRYGYGILAALAFDIWDHYILRASDCLLDGLPSGCMGVYTHRFAGLQMHHFEWALLDTVFDGVQRHYGDEAFFAVELLFVGLLAGSILWLRSNHALPVPAAEVEE